MCKHCFDNISLFVFENIHYIVASYGTPAIRIRRAKRGTEGEILLPSDEGWTNVKYNFTTQHYNFKT